MRPGLFVLATAAAACGRSGFAVPSDAGDDGGIDSGFTIASCPIPARPDVSLPTTVVSTCNESQSRTAIAAGGTVVFNCPLSTVILLTQPLLVPNDTVIAGNGVVFDGQTITTVLQVQTGAQLTLMDAIVTRGSSGSVGAGVRVEFGADLVVFDSTFTDNHGPASSATDGGGAIGALPSNATVQVYRSRFERNRSANGGAIQAYADLTIMSSVLRDNHATGTNGGNGGAIAAVGNGDLTMCDVTIESNTAETFSGGIHRVSTDGSSVDRWERVHLVWNVGSTSVGGAYVQDVALTLRQVEVVSNLGGTAGGLWILGTRPFDGENVSINDNTSGAFGAGLRLGNTPGRLAFATVTNNDGTCNTCESAALDGAVNLTLVASVIAENTAGTAPFACRTQAIDGGWNYQWPSENPACTSAITFIDPMLAPTAPLSGPAGTFRIRRPIAGTPITVVSTGCPAEDILGNPRPVPCTAGSVEP